MESEKRTVAILGGGITGLTAAYYLMKENLPIRIVLIEKEEQLGGKIQTATQDGFTIERGPDSFLERKPSAKKLCVELGLETELVNNSTGQSYILSQGKLHPIPKGTVMGIPSDLDAFKESSLFTEEGIDAAAADLEKEKLYVDSDISVGEFYRYRLGDEVVDRLIHPLISGIYSGDIDQLSLQATFPQYLKLEQEHGSLIRGVQSLQSNRQSSAKKKGQFLTLKDGLGALVKALKDELEREVELQMNTTIEHIERVDDQYQITTNKEVIAADAIISTIPYQMTQQVFDDSSVFVDLFNEKHTSVANIAMAFPKAAVKDLPEGTGFVVARKDGYRITACTFTHKKWPHTTPEDSVLLRAYVGQPGDEAIIKASDDEIESIVLEDLKQVIDIEGSPLFRVITRWENAMPQYTTGHLERLNTIELNISRQYPNLYLAGNSYRGVGIPDCMDQAIEAVNQLKEELNN